MRIAAINGVAVRRTPISRDAQPQRDTGDVNVASATADSASADSSGRRPGGWAQRREYRSTYRDTLFTAEKLIAGKWFGESQPREGEPADEVSLEVSIAADLDVTIGDHITWDVQGAQVETRVTSLREVNWARFEPNFYAVFPTLAIEKAPQTFVALASAPDSTTGRFQRDLALAYPNVASVDLTLIRNTVGEISRQASTAIQFLTLFSLAMGVPVLFSAVAATRRERVREGVLLKTLGATRRQIGRILFSEYALLGLLGSATGMVLSIGGAWALMRWVFERPLSPALLQASAIALAMLVLAVSIGLLSGRDVFKETPMTALRDV
jgi:putative ABC transport system permease protein